MMNITACAESILSVYLLLKLDNQKRVFVKITILIFIYKINIDLNTGENTKITKKKIQK